MTDMTVNTYRWCATNEAFNVMLAGSGPSNAPTSYYKVTYGAQNKGPYSINWHCECKAFRFGKGKECKHIIKAKTMKCSHGFGAVCGSPEAFPIPTVCPKCGGPTAVVQVAA